MWVEVHQLLLTDVIDPEEPQEVQVLRAFFFFFNQLENPMNIYKNYRVAQY